MSRILFVNGFNRSGTTLVTAALAEAASARTLTVGDLAGHIPSLARFLAAARKRGTVPDRGVDRLPVTESTPEEYGWLLHARTGEFGFGPEAAGSGLLDALVAELADGPDRAVVLKNPWDTGRERLLLEHFPDSRVVLVRRRLSAIEASVARAWERMATSTGYLRALLNDKRRAAELIAQLLNPRARQLLIRDGQRRMRREAVRLARGVRRLPPDRVAFLCYDELREDPRAAVRWAGHLVDPEALARAVTAYTFPEYHRAAGGGGVVRAIDAYWALAWRRARRRQVRAGILPAPAR